MDLGSDPNPPQNWMDLEPPEDDAAGLAGSERWSRWHNQVAEALRARLAGRAEPETRLLTGFLEIANFMLKNTCGVGSNFKLAECRLDLIESPAIHRYYTLVLTALAHHFGQLLPNKKAPVWECVRLLADDPEVCEALARELEECRDHQDGSYSPIRAGRKLWERVAEVLRVTDPLANDTARIYYQTAPGQDLVYLVEQSLHEGWFSEE
jgi:hypothetical protein